MSKFMIFFGATFLVFVLFCLISGGCVIGTLNKEAQSRNKVIAQTKVVEAHFDKMWKIIAQTTQVTKMRKDQQKELVEALVSGRQSSFIKIITESNPEAAFSGEMFVKLSNSIEGQREGFFREQQEMIDIGRENHLMFDTVPDGLILSFLGREKVELPPVISSTKSKEVIESGLDDDISLGN